jgi:hypothetical protein
MYMMTDTVTSTSTSTSATTILYDYLLEQGIDEQVDALSDLAVELRDGQFPTVCLYLCNSSRCLPADDSAAKREETGRSDLVTVIVQLLQRADTQDAAHRAKLYEQAGRVVANLVADNEPNRAAILQTDYIAAALQYVDAELGADGAERRRMEHEEEKQAARKAVIASLLNLVIQGHGTSPMRSSMSCLFGPAERADM